MGSDGVERMLLGRDNGKITADIDIVGREVLKEDSSKATIMHEMTERLAGNVPARLEGRDRYLWRFCQDDLSRHGGMKSY